MSAIFLWYEQGSEGPQNNADWLKYWIEEALWRPGELTTETIERRNQNSHFYGSTQKKHEKSAMQIINKVRLQSRTLVTW